MGFQSQLFSDKGLYEHLGRPPSCVLANHFEEYERTGVPLNHQSSAISLQLHGFRDRYTFGIGTQSRLEHFSFYCIA